MYSIHLAIDLFAIGCYILLVNVLLTWYNSRQCKKRFRLRVYDISRIEVLLSLYLSIIYHANVVDNEG